jgi:hypothetical protein
LFRDRGKLVRSGDRVVRQGLLMQERGGGGSGGGILAVSSGGSGGGDFVVVVKRLHQSKGAHLALAGREERVAESLAQTQALLGDVLQHLLHQVQKV